MLKFSKATYEHGHATAKTSHICDYMYYVMTVAINKYSLQVFR